MFVKLADVFVRYLKNCGYKDCILMTDGGSENMGKVKELITTAPHPAIQHLIAQVDVDFSNSMVEHTIKKN